MDREVHFCIRCGHAVEHREAFGAVRPVCPQCGRVHFFDPKVAVGVVVEGEGKLLLVRRRYDPEKGKWSVPAGYVDAGEDPARAAVREVLEETGLEVRLLALWDVIGRASGVEGADIFIVYRAEAVGGLLTSGDDAEAVGYFEAAALPELAFASTRRIVLRWVEETDGKHQSAA